MEVKEIQLLLEEHKDYMRGNCPAYRLACVIHETLEDILGSWPEIGPAFLAYAALRRECDLRYCAVCYEKNKKLSELSQHGLFVYEDERDLSQDMILARKSDDEVERQTCKALEDLIRRQEKAGIPCSFWRRYQDVCIDRADFEAMYCCWFGCRAGSGTQAYKDMIRRRIEPSWEYDTDLEV